MEEILRWGTQDLFQPRGDSEDGQKAVQSRAGSSPSEIAEGSNTLRTEVSQSAAVSWLLSHLHFPIIWVGLCLISFRSQITFWGNTVIMVIYAVITNNTVMMVVTFRFTHSKWRSNYDGGGCVNNEGHSANYDLDCSSSQLTDTIFPNSSTSQETQQNKQRL